MKYLAAILAFLFLAGPAYASATSKGPTIDVVNVAALTAAGHDFSSFPSIYLEGYTNPGDGGGGHLVLTTLGSAICPTADNFVCFQDGVGNYYGRDDIASAATISPMMFGATCDGLEYWNTGSTTASSTTVSTGSVQLAQSYVGATMTINGVGHVSNDLYVNYTSTLQSGGSGFVSGDVGKTVIFSDGTTIVVGSLITGSVATFYFTAYGANNTAPATLSQTGGTAGGTGVVLTPVWQGPTFVSTITAVGTNNVTLADAPFLTKATTRDWTVGHIGDGIAINAALTYAASHGMSDVVLTAGAGASECLTDRQIELTTNSDPLNNNPYLRGSSGIILKAMAPMANVIHHSTTASTGGGIVGLTVDGNGLVTNSTTQLIATRSYLLLDNVFQGATGHTSQLMLGDGSTATPGIISYGNVLQTNGTIYGVKYCPDYQMNITAGASDGKHASDTVNCAWLRDIIVSGSGNNLTDMHPFNTGYPNVAPVYGIEIANNSWFSNTEFDNSLGTTAGIFVNAVQVRLSGTGAICNTTFVLSTPYIAVASGKSNVNINGSTAQNSCNISADNMIVQQGTAGAGTIICGNSGASYQFGCGVSTFSAPQGRLTLQTGVPVMTADQTAKTTVYYDTFVGNQVPVWNGNSWNPLTITSDEVSMGLDTTNFASGSVHDVFGINNATALALCIGPAWTTPTSSRGTGVGTTELILVSGGLTNKQSLTHCYGGASGVTDYGTVTAKMATYLGSIYATANGQTGFAAGPNAASGGANNFIALYNAYNRVPVISASKDNSASWTQTSAGNWEPSDNSTSSRITVLDGLQTTGLSANVNEPLTNTTSALPLIGVDIDSTSATPLCIARSVATSQIAVACQTNSLPLLGLHYAQAVQNAANSTAGIYGSGLYLSIPWSY